MESQISVVVENAKLIESILGNKFNAVGNGLTEKVKCIEYNLPPDLVNSIRSIARTRNKVVHEADYKIGDLRSFVEKCIEVKNALENIAPFEAKVSPKFSIRAKAQISPSLTEASSRRTLSQKISLALQILLVPLGFFATFMAIKVKRFTPFNLVEFFSEDQNLFMIFFVCIFWTFWGWITYWLVKIYKEDKERANTLSTWDFFHDKLVLKLDGEEKNTISILYNTVKSVLFRDDTSKIEIVSVDRGVKKTFYLGPKTNSDTAIDELCQRIYEMVFRTGNNQRPTFSRQSYQDDTSHEGNKTPDSVLTSEVHNVNNQDSNTLKDLTFDTLNNSEVNPATGLPMVGAVDVEGNIYGSDQGSTIDISESLTDFSGDSSLTSNSNEISNIDPDDTFSTRI